MAYWLVALLLLTANGARAQALTARWVKQIGGPEQQRIWGMAVDGSGNVCVAGDFMGPTGFGPGTSFTNPCTGTNCAADYMFVAKYSPQGNLLWARNPTGALNVTKLAADAAGNVYVLGTFFNTITLGSFSLTVPGVGQTGLARANYLVKFNAQGTPQWLQLLPDAVEIEDLALAGHNRVCIIGTRSPNGAFVSCYDGAGTLQWQRQGSSTPNPSLGNTGSLGFSLAATRSGRILMSGVYGGVYQLGTAVLPAGATGSIGPIGSSFLGYFGDTFLAELDTLGNVGWVRHAATNGFVNARNSTLAIGPNGNTYLTDDLVVPITFRNGPVAVSATPPPNRGRSLYLVAYDAQGTPLWARTASTATPSLSHQLYSKALAVSPSGQVCLAGSFSNRADFGSQSVAVAGTSPRSDLFLARYDAAGTLLAVQRDGGAETDDRCWGTLAVDQTTGAVYLACESATYPPNGPTEFGGTTFTMGGITDAYIVALNAAGPLSARPSAAQASLQVAPNPALAGALLQVTLADPAAELQLLDATGRLVRRQPLVSGAANATVRVAGLAPGIYVLRATGARGVATCRVAIE